MAERGEVDTSSAFVSVKEAVSRFDGGAASSHLAAASAWRPNAAQLHLRPEEIELMKVEEETVKLEMELFVREREKFKVLRELESTKHRIDELTLQLQRGISQNEMPLTLQRSEEKFAGFLLYRDAITRNSHQKRSPNSTLIELQQAKVNLNKNTAQILKNKIEEERLVMERSCERVRAKTAKIASLEQDLNKIISDLEHVKGTKSDIQTQIKRIRSEKERNLEMKEAYKSEISSLIGDIEEAKSRAKTVHVRVLVARKMKEASDAAESIAKSEIKALIDAQKLSMADSEITLSPEEHAELIHRAQEAELISKRKIEAALGEIEQAEKSKEELLERVEDAMADVETSRKALNNALKREALAMKRKLESEEALRRWRSDHYNNNDNSYHKKALLHNNNSTKFKNSVVGSRKSVPGLLDVNGLSLVKKSKPQLSIGQILSMKLGPEEHEKRAKGKKKKNNNNNHAKSKSKPKPKISLGQILSQSYDTYSSSPFMIDDGTKQSKTPTKRKKLGVVIFTLLLAKQRNKKKQGLNPKGGFSNHKSG